MLKGDINSPTNQLFLCTPQYRPNAFQWGRQPSKIAHSPRGICTPI